MRIKQELSFSPVTIQLTTQEEAEAFWDIVLHYDNPADTPKKASKDLAVRISDWFSNEFHS